jgi:hypothetical protein
MHIKLLPDSEVAVETDSLMDYKQTVSPSNQIRDIEMDKSGGTKDFCIEDTS